MRDGCVFCDYAGPSPLLTEWGPGSFGFDGGYAIEPLEPVTAGHVLVIPRAHVASATAHPQHTAATIEAACWYAIENKIGDHNLILNTGPAATQTVPHLHVHVIPRREGDGLALPWPRVDVLRVSELAWVERRPGSVRVVIECDDELGAGFALERIRQHLAPEVIPADWLQRIEAQDAAELPRCCHDSAIEKGHGSRVNDGWDGCCHNHDPEKAQHFAWNGQRLSRSPDFPPLNDPAGGRTVNEPPQTAP